MLNLREVSEAVYDFCKGHVIDKIQNSDALHFINNTLEEKNNISLSEIRKTKNILTNQGNWYSGIIDGWTFKIHENVDKKDALSVIKKVLEIKHSEIGERSGLNTREKMSIEIGSYDDTCLASYYKNEITFPVHSSGRITGIAAEDAQQLDFTKLFLHEYGHLVLDDKKYEDSIEWLCDYITEKGHEEFLPVSPVFIKEMWNECINSTGHPKVRLRRFAEEIMVEVWAQKLFDLKEMPLPIQEITKKDVHFVKAPW
jgi:hypothetical protein